MQAAAGDAEVQLSPGFGIAFADLYRLDGQGAVDHAFLQFLGTTDAALCERLLAARAGVDAVSAKEESVLILDVAPHLERFIAELFGIVDEVAALSHRHDELAPLYAIKRQFVQRRAATRNQAGGSASVRRPLRSSASCARLFGGRFDELTFAQHVDALAGRRGRRTRPSSISRCAMPPGRCTPRPAASTIAAGVLFKAPQKTIRMHLVPHAETIDRPGRTASIAIEPAHLRRREGFALTDQGTDLVGALDQANYCIWCHAQGKDSCSKGLREKPSPTRREVTFKKSAFGVTLAGCPLEEKISEFQTLKAARPGDRRARRDRASTIRWCAATGHRICNDCMKSCIYQKQEPVDIPQAETRTLKDVLALPWGFEIYSLLTRWNPLNLRRPLPQAATGYRVLVVGMGPAGFSLAHHLMNDGHTVVGIDGLKIEPLPAELSGVRADGARAPFEPIRDAMSLYESLDERVMAGFGGVAEYGITVRWDKNFLKLVRLLLERRERVRACSAACASAARSRWTTRPAPMRLRSRRALHGRRQADDARHPERSRARRAHGVGLPDGAAAHRRGQARLDRQHAAAPAGRGHRRRADGDRHRDRVARLLRRPGGEVSRPLRGSGRRNRRGRDPRPLDDEEREIAEEFLVARARDPQPSGARPRAGDARRASRELLQHWGGATIAYRRRLIDSPSYTLNHEEVAKALEEGIVFAEGLTPLAVEVDEYGAARAVRVRAPDRPTARAGVDAGDVGCRPARYSSPRHAAQHGARARGCRAFPAGRQVLPRLRRRRASRSSPSMRWRSPRSPTCCVTRSRTAASSHTSATFTRRISATS